MMSLRSTAGENIQADFNKSPWWTTRLRRFCNEWPDWDGSVMNDSHLRGFSIWGDSAMNDSYLQWFSVVQRQFGISWDSWNVCKELLLKKPFLFPVAAVHQQRMAGRRQRENLPDHQPLHWGGHLPGGWGRPGDSPSPSSLIRRNTDSSRKHKQLQ